MTYVFHRAEGWYPIDVPADQVAGNIAANPGTLKVDNHHGETIWTQAEGWLPRASNKERYGRIA